MIDRDQLREALAKFDALPDDSVIVVKSFRTFPAFEAARLVASEDTLTITKVDGEWPAEIVLSVSHEGDRRTLIALLDALLEGQPK